MNIDLRNISQEFEKAVNDIKSRHDIATNSKALEYCALRHIDMLDNIKGLEKELLRIRRDYRELQESVQDFKEAFQNFMK